VELTRRGIFGLLGGALLAKVVGPQLIAAPTPKLWEAAKVLPRRPIINTYLPLEYVCAETLRIIHEDLKWLRLRQVYEDCPYDRRYGDEMCLSRRARLEAIDFDNPPAETPLIVCGAYDRILYDSQMHVDLDLSTLDPECPFGHISQNYVEPAAHQLAEHIIRDIRYRGGAEALVTGRLAVPHGVDRCVLSQNEESGLAIRAVEVFGLPYSHDGKWQPNLRIDMLYGLG
jgi:hypothetical protein